MKRFILATIVLASFSVSAFSAEPFMGKWVSNPKDCKSDDLPITIKPAAIIGATFGCTEVKFVKKGASWRATGNCSNEESSFDLKLDLSVNQGKLTLDWNDKDGSPMTYTKCPN